MSGVSLKVWSMQELSSEGAVVCCMNIASSSIKWRPSVLWRFCHYQYYHWIIERDKSVSTVMTTLWHCEVMKLERPVLFQLFHGGVSTDSFRLNPFISLFVLQCSFTLFAIWFPCVSFLSVYNTTSPTFQLGQSHYLCFFVFCSARRSSLPTFKQSVVDRMDR